ncbi:MAG: pyridoxal-dependent decarboxylase, partial [Bacteroidales bacterium]|nr:pyridoxal-dependent decarboxylase [Bacteroidales bacterium]
YKTGSIDGVFAAGGAEANLTAILCALDYTFPDYAANGLMGIPKRPIIYCSKQAHHSINKAAKIVGLGYMSVRGIAVNKELKIDIDILQKQIEKDLEDGGKPFMLIGTAGTTGSGEIDDLPLLKQIAIRHNLWFHVDAAWGGGAILSKKLKPLLKGIEDSDSITFDAHKWMSVPMGTSLFITSVKEILARTFRVTTEYMPKEASALDITDPYTHSIQWSRRFIGLRVYLSLLFYGWEGYEEVIDHQTRMGNLLRAKLLKNKWNILNKSPLPLVCFSDETYKNDHNFTSTILQNILDSGKSWISIYPINTIPAFRVCITNYNTSEKDLDKLVDELNTERERYINTIKGN